MQIGKASELRVASLAILGSGGVLELVPPLADDVLPADGIRVRLTKHREA